ncbi:MAG: zinc ribbon domain-containing protein [Burkholderiales bacterium]|nr:zinc ribbon domain-containing protein [Burkholderiales bacterium]
MPIYAYKCESCGHRQDVLQKISDRPLDTCPACGAATFVKQVTAAGFQLKGSGWYVTDFRGNGKAAEAKKPDATAEGGGRAEGDAKPAGAPAAAPSPAPAAAPASAAAKPGSTSSDPS